MFLVVPIQQHLITDPAASIDDGNCCFVSGCTDPLYTEYDALACM